MTEKTEEELKQAVIDAVGEWSDSFSNYTVPNTIGLEVIFRAYKALRASRKPNGVRPEEVGPGGRFMFVHYDGSNVAIMMRHDERPAFRWDDEDPNVCRSFMPCDSMVIPIEEDGECEFRFVEREPQCTSCGKV